MPNTAPFGFGRAPLVDNQGNPSRPFLKFLQTIATQTQNALTQIGVLKSTVQIQGQSGTIGARMQNLDPTGTFQNLDHVANGITYARPLGAELTSAGHLAQLQATQVDTSAGTILSQVGTSSTISVSAFTEQYGTGPVSYNSGTVTAPSNTSTGYVYFPDPNRTGGAVAYQFTTNYSAVFTSQGNVMVGKITLSAGGGASGGGGGGGNGNPCFLPNVRLRNGAAISSLKVGDYVGTLLGSRAIKEVIRRNYDGIIVHMGNDEWVTEGHHFVVGGIEKTAGELWAEKKHYSGKVWNLEIDTEREEERNYFLANGMLSHNFRLVSC